MILAAEMERAITGVAEEAGKWPPTVFATSRLRWVETSILCHEKREVERLVNAPIGTSIRDELENSRRHLAALLDERRRLLAGGVTTRPPRRMPSLLAIARFHDLGCKPVCVKCGRFPPVDRWQDASPHLERAHIVDRWAGGLDHPANLAPLCGGCHRYQPIFLPQDHLAALLWFGLWP